MLYLPFIVIIVIGICIYLYRKHQVELLEKYGISAKGVILENAETNGKDFYRLGGNFNTPTIQFSTKQGKVIVGKPIIGFTSQSEIISQTEVNIIYDPENPENFCIDLS